MRLARLALVAAIGLGVPVACGDPGHDHDHDHDHGDHGHAEHGHGDHGHGGTESSHGHVHVAQHGGVLVILGEETAHLEFVHDAATGGLTCYVLGPHAESAVRIAQERIVVDVDTGSGALQVELAAVADELSGERVGDTSVFRALDDRLKSLERFSGTVRDVTVKGQTHAGVAFTYDKKDGS